MLQTQYFYKTTLLFKMILKKKFVSYLLVTKGN